MEYKVYIPSKGRAGKVTSHKLFKESTIICPKSEEKNYKDYHKNVIGIPNEVKGITSTRNWILNNINDDWHVQVDDDAISFYKHENAKTNNFIDINKIDKIITNQFYITNGWGLKSWGLALASDYKFYREYQPFSTQKMCGANIIGIIKNPIRFDERLKVKEDYDYSMQHIHKYGGILRYMKYGINVIHLTNEGGCVSYRTKEIEMNAYQTLKKKWGSKIVILTNNKNFLRLKSPRKGI